MEALDPPIIPDDTPEILATAGTTGAIRAGLGKVLCFPGETPVCVATHASGEDFKPIEAIKEGEFVGSFNADTGSYECRQVTRIFTSSTDRLIELTYGGTTLRSTEEHLFYIKHRNPRWVTAEKLKIGDPLFHVTGGAVRITDKKSVYGRFDLWNLEVDGNNNYYAAGVLVHNCNESMRQEGRIQTQWPTAQSAESPSLPLANGQGSVDSAGVRTLNPNEIRFSQSSVNDARPLTESMRNNGWVGEPIDVVRSSDGSYITVDNTRVLAASRAGIQVQSRVHEATEALPPEFVDRFTTRGGVPQTWGDAIRLRIERQSAGWRNQYPNGSPVTGKMEIDRKNYD